MDRPNPIVSASNSNSGDASPFDRIMLLDHSGNERWSARDLQVLMGYVNWQEFEKVVSKARDGLATTNIDALDHFMGAHKVIKGGRWGTQQVTDYRLTRFGAYQVALAGDSRKPEVAAAKVYFAVKTREAEVASVPEPDVSSAEGILALAEKYVEAARELVTTKKELAIAAPKASKWDAFCDADGLIDMGTAAKALTEVTGGLGRTKFMALLREEHVRFLQVQNPRIPYEVHIKGGRAKVKMVQAANGGWVEQTFFTPKGLDWIATLIGGAALPAA